MTLTAEQLADELDRKDGKHRAVILFGDLATKIFRDTGDLTEAAQEGDVVLSTFDTLAEVNAYLKGVMDAEGWMEAEELSAEALRAGPNSDDLNDDDVAITDHTEDMR